MKLNALLCGFLLFFFYESKAQYNIDSVKKIFAAATADSTKIKECTAVSTIFYKQGMIDSARRYALITLALYAERAKDLPFEKRKLATKYYSYAQNTLGLIASTEAKYPEALDHFYKGIEAAEQTKDLGTLARCKGNIAIVFTNTGDLRKALEYFDDALKLYEKTNSRFGIAMITLNKGICYTGLKDSLQALRNYEKTLIIAKEINHAPMAATCLGNIGTYYGDHKQYEKAVPYFTEALELALKFDSPENISRHYRNLGLLFADMKNYKKSFVYLYRSLVISDSIKNISGMAASYEYLSHLYEKSEIPLPDSLNGKTMNTEGMRLRAIYYLKRQLLLKLRIVNEENTKATFEKEAKFQFEQREALAKAEQEKKDIKSAEEKRKQQMILWFTVSGLGIVVVLAVIIFRSLILNKRKNKIISEQKETVEKQKLIVEEKQKEVLDSIRYAKRIQQSLLTSEKYIERKLNELRK
jgi:tetratricopeptide (TPR) repeat protein